MTTYTSKASSLSSAIQRAALPLNGKYLVDPVSLSFANDRVSVSAISNYRQVLVWGSHPLIVDSDVDEFVHVVASSEFSRYLSMFGGRDVSVSVLDDSTVLESADGAGLALNAAVPSCAVDPNLQSSLPTRLSSGHYEFSNGSKTVVFAPCSVKGIQSVVAHARVVGASSFELVNRVDGLFLRVSNDSNASNFVESCICKPNFVVGSECSTVLGGDFAAVFQNVSADDVVLRFAQDSPLIVDVADSFSYLLSPRIRSSD